MKLIAGREQSGHGAVVQMGGLDTLRQRVTDICTGYFIVFFRDRPEQFKCSKRTNKVMRILEK